MRKRKMKKRTLAALMTACMVVGAMPGVSFAEAGPPADSLDPGTQGYTLDGKPASGDVDILVSKSAVYNEDTDDYTVTLSTSAKSRIRTKKTEIVIVLDKSGSMAWCTEKNPHHRHSGGEPCDPVRDGSQDSRWTIAKQAIQSMTSDLTEKASFKYVVFDREAYQCDSSFTYSDWSGNAHEYEPVGSTNLIAGVEKGISLFSESKDTNKVLVIVADGEPDGDRFPTKQAADFKSASTNNTIYTVGFAYDAAGGPFKDLASGDDYFLEAGNDTELNEKMTEISENIKGLIVDPLGDQVEYVDGSLTTEGSEKDAVYDNNTISWSDEENGLSGTVALTYRVKVKDSVKEDLEHADTIFLNGDAELNYSYVDENEEIKIPGAISFKKPAVETAILEVNYVDEEENTVRSDREKVILNEKNTSFKTTLDDITDFVIGEGEDAVEYQVTEKPSEIPQPEGGKIASITVRVKSSDTDEHPTYDELKDIIGNVVLVHTGSNAEHQDAEYELIKGSYDITRYDIASASNAGAVVTVKAAAYKDAYNEENGTHTVQGRSSVKVVLQYDGNAWELVEGDLPVTFTVKCSDKKPDIPDEPEIPEKKYSDIKFVVVNGTFTENGKTEITKNFEVGTKITLVDIPASKGKSSSYIDAAWDKYPLGYVVGEEGTTFTITYKWKSSGGSSGGGGGSRGSIRSVATNAAGKSGRWILEGGEFTEDNGRLPSNEYLKIGDTIYGFYTYGFAIDFDRPEYYTDAAIQAKGGYREAKGTWRLNGWWFCYDDGTFPHSEWVYLTWNGHSDWYYFDVDGWMEDGWLRWNNNWYYLHTQYDNTRGHMYTGWHEIDGKWYYFNTASDKGTLGAMLANTTTPDGYKVDANGAWIR